MEATEARRKMTAQRGLVERAWDLKWGRRIAYLQLDLNRTVVVSFKIVCPRMTPVPGAHIWAIERQSHQSPSWRVAM